MFSSIRTRRIILASLAVLLVSASAAFADKASVSISAPDRVKKGTEITIKIKVTHSGNNVVHHVDWAWLSVNGKEVKRWEFSAGNLPESEIFEREFKYVVTAPVEISAEAHCNIHGSKGPVKKQIFVTE